MMAEHGNVTELSAEQQLNEQLQQISLEYQSLVDKSREMAPKGTTSKKIDPTAENAIDDEDLEEIANVADNLVSLESALDLIEERADRIREQLLELLTSNREIRQSIREENDKLEARQSSDTPDTNDKDTPTTPENNEPKPE